MGTPVQQAEPLALPPLQSRIQLLPKAFKVQIPKPPLPTLGRSGGVRGWGGEGSSCDAAGFVL